MRCLFRQQGKGRNESRLKQEIFTFAGLHGRGCKELYLDQLREDLADAGVCTQCGTWTRQPTLKKSPGAQVRAAALQVVPSRENPDTHLPDYCI